MANPTSNFGWQMPTSTDLVTDLPADFEVFGQAVDTSFADLKGGTTGQILAKNSNTDLDFVWTAATTGDITGVSVTSPITGGGTSGSVTIGIDSTAVVPSQTGNSGKYLTTNGTSSSWGTVATGSMTLLSTTSLSGSSYVTISGISQAYTDLKIVMQAAGNSSNVQHYMTAWKSGTQTNFNLSWANGTAVVSSGSGNGYPTMTFRGSSAINNTFVWELKRYTSANACTVFSSGYLVDSGGVNQKFGGGGALTGGGVDELQIYPNSGTFNAGTIYIYGVN